MDGGKTCCQWLVCLSVMMCGTVVYGQAVPTEELEEFAGGHSLYGRIYGSLDWYEEGGGVGGGTITRVDTHFSFYNYDSFYDEYWRDYPVFPRGCGYLELEIHFEPYLGIPFVIELDIYRGGAIVVGGQPLLYWSELRQIVNDAHQIVQDAPSNTIFPMAERQEDTILMQELADAFNFADQGQYPTFYKVIPMCGPSNLGGGGSTVVNVDTFDPGNPDEVELDNEVDSHSSEFESDFLELIEDNPMDEELVLEGLLPGAPSIATQPLQESFWVPLNKLGAQSQYWLNMDTTAINNGLPGAGLGWAVDAWRMTFRFLCLSLWTVALVWKFFTYAREM